MPADAAGVAAPAGEHEPRQDGKGLAARLSFAQSRTARRFFALLPWIAAAAWVTFSLNRHFHEMPWGQGWEDAYVYQRAADNFLRHPSHLYDLAMTQLASSHAQAAFIYPPSGLIPFLALAPIATDAAGNTTHAGEAMAASIWTAINLILLFVALTIFGRRVGLSFGRLGTAMLLLSFTPPVLVEINSGQVDGLELLLLVLAWGRMPRVSGGVLLGVALALKPVAALFLVALLLRRRWRALGAAVGTLAVLTLPFAILIGVDGIRYYVTDVGPFMLRQDTWDAANLSLSSITQTFLAGRGVDTGDMRTLAPIASAALALALLVAIRAALAAGVVVALVRERLNGDLEFAMLAATIPLTAGTVWFHYYLYVVPLLFIAMTSRSTVLRIAAWVVPFPALFNGLFLRWVIDPYRETDLWSRVTYGKAQALPLLVLALVGVFLSRAYRPKPTPVAAMPDHGSIWSTAAIPVEWPDSSREISLSGRSSRPVAPR